MDFIKSDFATDKMQMIFVLFVLFWFWLCRLSVVQFSRDVFVDAVEGRYRKSLTVIGVIAATLGPVRTGDIDRCTSWRSVATPDCTQLTFTISHTNTSKTNASLFWVSLIRDELYILYHTNQPTILGNAWGHLR